ncbi:MAG: 50S ribosomal protein L6 [Deferribacteraceae bacterium]|jgi:large subunit ribosomal protein L6|nr:50S ribosomal protein L6 [Deferribacteraceae bacterium]
MSRIGKKPITVPGSVKVEIKNNVITVEGPKGKLSQAIPARIALKLEDGVLTVERKDESQESSALSGLVRTLVGNMVTGVTTGFTKTLDIVGVGYRVALKEKSLDFNLGRSHPVIVEPPAGIEFAVEGTNKIHVKGIDKQLVGQVAANIRMLRKPEPYKGKGIRYLGERVVMKAGKTGKK